MAENYRIKYKSGDFEIEIESTDKSFVETKLTELTNDIPKTVKTNPPKKVKAEKTTVATVKSQPKSVAETESADDENGIDVVKIVNAIYDAENHDIVEEKILKKSNQLNRILMVFAFVNKVYDHNTSITTGDIENITDQLGVRIKRPNAANKIKANSKFFAADSVRKKGSVTKYKINRKGLEEFDKIISN
ncbi:MAG: hypothetical protein ABJK11_13900 [Balneola sp.]